MTGHGRRALAVGPGRPAAPRPVRSLSVALAVGLLATSPLLSARSTIAGERGSAPSGQEERLNAQRRLAIQRGCEWIAGNQWKEGGGFGNNKGLVAITSLATLALMAEGSGMGRGPHGENVARAVKFLVELGETHDPTANVPFGYIHHQNDGTSRMHGHGYAMLALASALGTADEKWAPRIRDVLRRAVSVSEASQTPTGGWGYNPTKDMEHEGSVTVTIAQGLRAARDAGIAVPEKTVKNGLFYLIQSQRNTGDEDDGSFKYSLSQERSTYALTAAALSSFYLFGEYGTDAVSRGRMTRAISYIKRKVPSVSDRREWFFYGNFYAAWAAWQKDGNLPDPEPGSTWTSDPRRNDAARSEQFWGPWHAKMYPVILRGQTNDGKWSDSNDDHFQLGDLLPTAFAVLTLAIPDENVPIFQR